MWASQRGHAKTVELLLERGANTEITDTTANKRTALQLAEARGFVGIADLIQYCAEQAKINNNKPSSFGEVIARAAVVKSAVASFKSTLGHVSISADCKKVEPAATTIEKFVRGRSDRKLIEKIDKEVAEAPPSVVSNLAKRAMMTSQVTKKLKATIVPMGSKLAKQAHEAGEKRRAAAAAAAQTLAEVAAAQAAEAAETDVRRGRKGL